MNGGERAGIGADHASTHPLDIAARMRAVFAGARFIHIVTREIATYFERVSGERDDLVESWMGPDRIKSVAKDSGGRFVGAILLVDGRATEVGGDRARHEYATDADATGLPFPRYLNDYAHHALADHLESWVTPRSDDDAPTWFIDAVARGVWRGNEIVEGRERLAFEDMHMLAQRRVTHRIHVDAETMLPRLILTTSRDENGVRSLSRGFVTFEVFAQDPGWEWRLDD